MYTLEECYKNNPYMGSKVDDFIMAEIAKLNKEGEVGDDGAEFDANMNMNADEVVGEEVQGGNGDDAAMANSIQ